MAVLYVNPGLSALLPFNLMAICQETALIFPSVVRNFCILSGQTKFSIFSLKHHSTIFFLLISSISLLPYCCAVFDSVSIVFTLSVSISKMTNSSPNGFLSSTFFLTKLTYLCTPFTQQPPILWPLYRSTCLQCFDAVGWAAGRASGL